MSDGAGDSLAVALLSEIATVEQLAQAHLKNALPRGMEVSHFAVLNHFAGSGGEKTPGQLARAFHVTKGAMTNTLRRLEHAGYIHIRPDKSDARSKKVSLSEEGRRARDEAVRMIAPVFDGVATGLGSDKIRSILPIMRELREHMNEGR